MKSKGTQITCDFCRTPPPLPAQRNPHHQPPTLPRRHCLRTEQLPQSHPRLPHPHRSIQRTHCYHPLTPPRSPSQVWRYGRRRGSVMNARRPSLASSLRLLSLIVIVYYCQWMPRGGLCLMHAPGAASYPLASYSQAFSFRSFRWAAWSVRWRSVTTDGEDQRGVRGPAARHQRRR